MNHQRFKFYKHSTSYYKSLYNTITEIEDKGLEPCITQYPSTINRLYLYVLLLFINYY